MIGLNVDEFTEDPDKITSFRTCYVTGLRTCHDEELVKRYMTKQVGAVSKIKIRSFITNQNYLILRYAFIEFSNSTDAARAVFRKKFSILNHWILVYRAADQYQPIDGSIVIKQNPIPLLKMNDYCLLEIMKNLKILDIINLSIVYPRLNYLAQSFIYYKETEFNCLNIENISFKKFELLLTQIGPYLKKISITKGIITKAKEWEILEMILIHCKNLNVLKLTSFTKNIERIKIPKDATFNNIKILVLVGCYTLSDKFVRTFVNKCFDLESFILHGNNHMTGDLLWKNQKLIEFHLVCTKISKKGLMGVIEHNAQLRSLVIKHCESHIVSLNYIAAYLPNLVHLGIDMCIISSPVTYYCLLGLKKLRHIQISCNLGYYKHLEQLRNLNWLEELEIHNDYHLVTLFSVSTGSKKQRGVFSPKFILLLPINLFELIYNMFPRLKVFRISNVFCGRLLSIVEFVQYSQYLEILSLVNMFSSINYKILINELIKMLALERDRSAYMSTHRRPILNLILQSNKFDDKTVELLKENTHLMIVTKYNKNLHSYCHVKFGDK